MTPARRTLDAAVVMASEDRELVELEWLMLDVDDVELPSLEEFLARPAWHSLAACADEPRSTFFLARGEDASRAKAICAGCEVRSECLDYALGFPERDLVGIWGGATGQERRRLRAARASDSSGPSDVAGAA